MAVSSAVWSSQLQTSLESWATGRPDLGGKGLQQCIGMLQGPAMAIWRALVYNQLALLSNELGHWQYAKEQWELAEENWRSTGVAAGSPELADTLDWYCQLLSHYGFPQRAEQVRKQHAQGQVPLLDPWTEDSSPVPALAQVTTPRVAASPKAPAQEDEGPPPAPLGGQRVASQPLAGTSQYQDWDQWVSQGLKLAAQGKLQPALAALDRARAMGVSSRAQDGGHLLALVYCAESVACFQAGDYSQAAQAKQEAMRLWTDLRNSSTLFKGDTHSRFVLALRRGDQEAAADLFWKRHEQRHCPLIDPWADLDTGLARGEWEQVKFSLAKDWKGRLDTALQHLMRGNFQESQKELGLMQQHMSELELRGPAGPLLLQVQSLVAYAAGDYDTAQSLFTQGKVRWDEMPRSQRSEGRFLDELKGLLTLHGLESIGDVLGDALCDPFVYYKPEGQMARLEKQAPTQPDGDVRETWEDQLKEAWELARQQRWEGAQRRAHHAERVARLVSPDDLRVAFSLNSQAVFAQAAGNYAEAEELYQQAVRGWKRGAATVGARPAWAEFCSVLFDTGWTQLGEQVEKAWEKPEARSGLSTPVLLPLDALSQSGMATVSAAASSPAVVEGDGVLRLPGELLRPAAPPAPESSGGKSPLGLILVLVVLLLAGGGAYMVFGKPKPGKTPAAQHAR